MRPRGRRTDGVQRQLNRLIHALRPLVPPVGWEVLQTSRSYSSGGALVLTPPHSRVLILAPHPDDEIIGCGGTTALLQDSGRAVRTVIASGGEELSVPGIQPIEVASRRREDAERAAGVLGTPPPVFLGFADGELSNNIARLASAIGVHVDEFQPDAIFAPWLLDAHPDHEALAMAVAHAAVPPKTEIWGYEVWAPLPPNRLVDITKVWDRKVSALAEHQIPASVFNTSGHLALNRWRSIHFLGGSGHAEAFLALPFSTYKALATAEPADIPQPA